VPIYDNPTAKSQDTLRIATWNINSVRLRAPLIAQIITDIDPDIICLQETKVIDPAFPQKIFIEMGYSHIHMHGMKSYNGVAILSRVPFDAMDIIHHCEKQDCRHIMAVIKGVSIHNLYIPAGGDEPDVTINPKFQHKLDFVESLTRYFKEHHAPNSKQIVLGDFNIAPLEHDVWSHKQLLNVVSHTPIEVEKLNAMRDSIAWVDAIRHFVPKNEKCYSWWSYRNQDWEKSNRGRRLDHIWITPILKESLRSCGIVKHARNYDRPSDHVPVWIDLAF
jgi:exodeoxyribonuclease-3